MSEDVAEPDDIAARMEALWGSPRATTVDDVRRPARVTRQATTSAPPPPEDDGVRAHLDAAVARVVSDVAAVEASLNHRVDELAADIAIGFDRGAQDVNADLLRLAEAVDALQAASVTAADVDAGRDDLSEGLFQALRRFGEETEADLARRLADAKDEMERKLAVVSDLVEHLTESVADGRAATATMRAELAASVRATEDHQRLVSEFEHMASKVERLGADMVTSSGLDDLRAAVAGGAASEAATTGRVDALEQRLSSEAARIAGAVTVADLDAVRAGVVDRLDGQMAASATDAARLAALESALRADVARSAEHEWAAKSDLDSLRDEIRAGVERLIVLHEESVAASDARIAGTERRVQSRLEEIACAVGTTAEAAAAGQVARDQLEAFERETSRRLTALEGGLAHAVEAASVTAAGVESARADEADRMAETFERVSVDLTGEVARAADGLAVARADLTALRSDLEYGLVRAAEHPGADVTADLQQRFDDLAGQVAALEAASSRVGAIEERVDQEVERLGAAQTADRSALADLRSQVTAALERLAPEVGHADLVALQGELEAAVAKLAALSEEIGGKLDALEALTVGADDRVHDRVNDRLDEMARWVLAEVMKQLEPEGGRRSRSEPSPVALRPLQNELSEVRAFVADLQQQIWATGTHAPAENARRGRRRHSRKGADNGQGDGPSGG